MKRKPLITRLRAARILLKVWRRAIFESHVDGVGPSKGEVSSEAEKNELARFDAADTALKEVIAVVATDEQPHSMEPIHWILASKRRPRSLARVLMAWESTNSAFKSRVLEGWWDGGGWQIVGAAVQEPLYWAYLPKGPAR